MCAPIQNQSCNCSCACGCVSALTIEDEIRLLEAGKQRMQVQINMVESRIEELKKKIWTPHFLCEMQENRPEYLDFPDIYSATRIIF
jgi:hypothetical protein